MSVYTTNPIRAKEDPRKAEERGLAFHKKIYGRNPEFTPSSTASASPDYAYVIRCMSISLTLPLASRLLQSFIHPLILPSIYLHISLSTPSTKLPSYLHI